MQFFRTIFFYYTQFLRVFLSVCTQIVYILSTITHFQFRFNISHFKYKVLFSDVFIGCNFPLLVKSAIFCFEQPSIFMALAEFTIQSVTYL